DLLLKLAGSAEDLQPLSILIPILERIKTDGEPELKNKAKRILGMIASEGISSFSDTKEKDEKIHQLEEENKRKDQELIRKDEENRKMKEELNQKDEENKKLKYENQKFKEQISNEKEKQNQKEKEEKNKQIQKEKEAEEQKRKQKEIPIIAILNPDPAKIDVTDINDGMKKIIKKQNCWYTFSLAQVLENGIWSLEAQFSNLIGNGVVIGVVRDSHNIAANSHPTWSPNKEHMAVIGEKKWTSNVWYKGICTSGNQGFDNNEIVRLEFDSEKTTLTFFLNSVQQPVYISGINEKVRFVIALYKMNETCIIRSLKKLEAPTTVHVVNEKAVQW
ncbi:MAG: hypothetical protein EZS28_037656, partial [Streblomastix strix]